MVFKNMKNSIILILLHLSIVNKNLNYAKKNFKYPKILFIFNHLLKIIFNNLILNNIFIF